MAEQVDISARFPFGPVLLLIAIVLITALLFPGDTPFVGDEALVMQLAHATITSPANFSVFRSHSPPLLSRWQERAG